MDKEEFTFTVRNADTDEVLTIAEATSKFGVMTLDAAEAKRNSHIHIASRNSDVDDIINDNKAYYDAKDGFSLSNPVADSKYIPLSIPTGGRITFRSIKAIGSSKDPDDKEYNIYILDVHCAIASPSSWYVYRRYSQFTSLSDKLRSEGYIVPLLTTRLLDRVTKHSLDFLRERRQSLEQWLISLAIQHESRGTKDPQNNAHYRAFLTDDANERPNPFTLVWPDHISGNSGLIAESKTADSDAAGSKYDKSKVTIEDFELIRVIGKGSFGKVTLVKKKDNSKMYAMKVLSKSNVAKRKQVEHTRTERRVLATINHPFIVKLHYAFQTDSKLYFVLDYAAGGELFFHLSRMKKFPEHLTRFYCAEISLALDCLHANDIVYRDLKPENILLDGEGHIKLADFGLAKEGVSEAAEGAHSLCGTPEYLSPEVLDRQGHGTAVDWWNLGMVTYEMLTGLPPWYTTDREKLFDRLRHAPLKFPFYVNRPAASFIQALLNRNPIERLGASGGSQVKNHPFFSSIDWDAMMRREVTPPFNPCRNQDISDSDNFEKEFTNMPVNSIDEGSTPSSRLSSPTYSDNDSETFLNFTYEEESVLTRELEARSASRDSIRK